MTAEDIRQDYRATADLLQKHIEKLNGGNASMMLGTLAIIFMLVGSAMIIQFGEMAAQLAEIKERINK